MRNTKSCLLEQTRSNLCHVGSVCSFHLVCATRLEEKRGTLEKARSTPCPCRFSVFLLTPEKNHGALEQGRSNLCHVASVKVRCVFLLMLEQTRSHRYHVGSVCSFHLVCSKHPVDKRGALDVHGSLFALSVQSVLSFSFNPRANTTHSVPCRLSQNPPPRTSAIRSVAFRLSQGKPPRTSSIRVIV